MGEKRASKRLRTNDASETEDSNELLARLNAQCAAFFGSSASQQPVLSNELDEDGSPDSESGSEDDFTGFGSDAEADEVSDDDEDLLADGEDAAPLHVFDDPSRSRDGAYTGADVKSFMSARVGRHLEATAASTAPKSRKEKKEDEEEQHLKELDASLATLIKDFDPSTMGSSVFSHTRKPTGSIQKNVPLPIRRGIERTRIKRAKRDAETDRVSGAVRAKGGNIDDGPAVNKRDMRKSSGAEDTRRRKARGLGGVVGRMGPGGSLLRLSADEVRRGNDGKEVHQLVKARKKGGYEGNRRLMVKDRKRKR